MKVAKVIGTIWATRKEDKLAGLKLLLVQPINVLTGGKDRLSRGKSIIVFPQATRSEEFRPERFNSIGIKLAKTAGVPVLPFALKTDFLGNGKYFRDLGPVRPERQVWFEFAPAREVEGNGQDLQHDIINFIQSRLAQWRAREQKH